MEDNSDIILYGFSLSEASNPDGSSGTMVCKDGHYIGFVPGTSPSDLIDLTEEELKVALISSGILL